MSAPGSFNIDEVCAWLRAFLDSFNFSLPGKDQNLGRDLAHVVVDQIAERSAVESRSVEGSDRWKANDPVYAALKAEHYGWPDYKPNYRTGQMLSHASLFGRTRVADQLVEVVYGTGDPPPTTYSPADDRTASEIAADESTADVDKAEWASAKRPFFEVDDKVEEAVVEAADDALETYILDVG